MFDLKTKTSEDC